MELKRIRYISKQLRKVSRMPHRDRMREVITNPLEPPKDSDNSSISLTCAVTLTRLTESESSFCLFSSEWEVGLRQKLAMVAKIEARRSDTCGIEGGNLGSPNQETFEKRLLDAYLWIGSG